MHGIAVNIFKYMYSKSINQFIDSYNVIVMILTWHNSDTVSVCDVGH